MEFNSACKLGISFLALLITSSVASQSITKELEGRVYSDDADVAATHVLNTTTSKAAITDENGYFTITVKLADTLIFSAVQYKRKILVVTQSIMESTFINVPMEEALTELDEVIVMPYNLTGDITQDAKNLGGTPIISAASLGLPNANVKLLTKAERQLFAATASPFMSIDPLINAITGRSKYLKKQVQLEKAYARTERVKAFYPDSLIVIDLKIPEDRVDDFMYFCEVDNAFQASVDTHDKLKIWEIMRRKSILYRKNNSLVSD